MLTPAQYSALETADDMPRYATWKPTGFDSPGLGRYGTMADRQDWRVFPCTQTRDSEALDLSNFAVAVAEFDRIDPDDDHHEIHRFGHWACGWIEILILDPAHEPTMIAAGEMINALSDYPVLDDEDLSRREYDDYCDAWTNYAARDFANAIALRHDLSPLSADMLYTAAAEDASVLRELYEQHDTSAGLADDIDGGHAAGKITRKTLADFLRQIRNARRTRQE